MNDKSSPSLNASKEVLAQTSSGYLMLLVLLAMILAAVFITTIKLMGWLMEQSKIGRAHV